MTDEIASLGIVIDDGNSIERSKKSLASLAEQGGKTEQALGKLGSKGKDSGRGIAEAGTAAERASEGINKVRQSAVLSDNALSGMITRVKALGAAYLSVQGVRALVGVSDEYTKYTAQLRLATRGQEEFNAAFANTNRIAGISQSDVSAVTVLYARLSNSLRDIGATQRELSDITETVSLALKVNGASATEASSAMLQLSQAFGSGVLRGEEFNAVNEAAPALLRQVAKEMGVQVGQLRELASEGKITRDVLRSAFTDTEYLSGLRSQVELTRTISGGFTELRNSLVNFVGSANTASGVSKGFGTVLSSLSRDVDYFTNAISGNKDGLEVWFRGFEQYRKRLVEIREEQNRVFSGDRANLLQRGSRLDQSAPGLILRGNARIDDKDAEAPDTLREKLIKQAAEFDKSNPINDLIAKQEEYAQKIKQVNQYETQGIYTAEKASRLRTQFAEQLNQAISKGAKTAKAAAVEQDEFTASLSQSYADLTKQLIGLSAPQETQAQILERMLGTMPHITQAYRDWAQIQLDMAKDKAFEDQIYQQELAAQDRIDSIRQQEQAVRDEVEALGKLPSAITAVTIARKQDELVRQQSRGLVVPDIEREIEALKRLAQVQGAKEFREAAIKAEKDRVDAAKDAAKEIQREYERMSDNINRSLTDALLRGFESGKSFAENFRDTLKNMFRALVLQPVVKFLVDASGISALGTGLVSMLSGGSASAGTLSGAGGNVGDAANLLGVGKNLYSAFTGGLDKLGATVTGSIQDLGVFLSNGNGGLADTIGGFLGQNSAQIANGLAYLPSVISLIRGDIKGAAFSAAGTALGSLLGPGGAIVGGAIGSLVGGLFGKDKPKRYGSTASGTYSGGTFTSTGSGNIGRALGVNSGLAGLNEAFAKSLGGLLSAYGLSDTVSTSSDMISRTNLRGGFYSSFDGGSVSYGNKFGKAGKVDINAAFQQMVAAVMGQTLVDAIQKSKLPEGIRALFSGFTDQAQVQSLISSVTQLNRYQADLTKQYNLTADSAAKVAKASGLAGQELIDFVNKITSTTLSLRTPGEAVLDAKSIIQEQLDAIIGPVAFPETIKAFDAMLKGIDTGTSEGVSQFAGLFGLRDAVAEFLSSLGNIKTGVTDAIFGLKTPEQQLAILQSNLAAAFGELGLSVPKTVAELIALGESIDFTTEEGLNLAAIFPSLVEGFLNTKDAATSLASSLGLLDINRFKNLVDYTRAQRYAVTGNLSKLPSFDVGTNIVPKDMVAKIHEGERIIPAADNKELMQRLDAPGGQDLSVIVAAINELKSVAVSTAKNMASLERRVRKWDGDGLPPERLVTA